MDVKEKTVLQICVDHIRPLISEWWLDWHKAIKTTGLTISAVIFFYALHNILQEIVNSLIK